MSLLTRRMTFAASEFTAGGGGGTVLATRTWDTDAHDGIIDWFGTNGATEAFANPATRTTGEKVVVYASTELQTSNYNAFLACDQSAVDITNSFASGDVPGSWWLIDFGVDRAIDLTHYGLRGRASGGGHPRSWKLQGWNESTLTWDDLDTQTSNTTIGDGTWYSTSLAPSTTYRVLRVLQTGVNSAGNDLLILGDVEFWGDIVEVTPTPAAGTYESLVTGGATTPLALWMMQEATGNVVDSMGLVDGTPSGTPSYQQAGPPGITYAIDTTSGHFAIAHVAALNIDPPWTIEGWVRTNARHVSEPAVLTSVYGGAGSNIPHALRVGDRYLGGTYSDPTGWRRAAGGAPPGVARWDHVVCTHTGTVVEMWRRGVKIASESLTAPSLSNTNGHRLGCRWDSVERLPGRLAAVGFYDAALPAAEVQSHWIKGAAS